MNSLHMSYGQTSLVALRMEWLRFWRDPLFYMIALARPSVWLLLLSSGFSGGRSSEGALFIALVTYACIFTGITSAFSLVWERDRGLLRLWLAYKVNRWGYVLGKCLFSLVITSIILVLTLIPGAAFTELGLNNVDWPKMLGAILVCEAVLCSLGVMIATCITRLDLFGTIINLILFPMLFTSGALYPVDKRSWLLTTISACNPLRHCVELLQASLVDTSKDWSIPKVTGLLVFSVLCYFIAGRLLRREV